MFIDLGLNSALKKLQRTLLFEAVTYSFPEFLSGLRLLFCHLSTTLIRFLLGVESVTTADDVVAVAAHGPVAAGVAAVQCRDDREGPVDSPGVDGERVDCSSVDRPVDDLEVAVERVTRDAVALDASTGEVSRL